MVPKALQMPNFTCYTQYRLDSAKFLVNVEMSLLVWSVDRKTRTSDQILGRAIHTVRPGGPGWGGIEGLPPFSFPSYY
jgi:hypothetical protein